ncbi:trypsin-7 [Anabrus simplex]|uniref:trypsin-7 n=1 Tax=Anabrus simplex TaxID=316456 RepID=UPI0035A39051
MLKAVVLLCIVAFCSGSEIPHRPRLDGRIIGGSLANIQDFPYQLSLESLGNHICGASVINEYWALTATHCIFMFNPIYVTIRAGTSSRGSGGTVHQAVEIVEHPNFDYWTLDYDFALIRVSTPFPVGSNVRKIELPSQGEAVAAGTSAVVTGWGATSEGGGASNVLQQIIVPVITNAQCNSAYGRITDRMICAGFTAGGKDACQGDSGGPLVVNGKLHGVVSWGQGCARPNYPGVYARVAAVRNWIKTSTGV